VESRSPRLTLKNYVDTTRKSLLEFRINLYGAAAKGKKKGIPNLIDFKTETDMVTPKDGEIRLDFVFCCYPKDHGLGDDEYL